MVWSLMGVAEGAFHDLRQLAEWFSKTPRVVGLAIDRRTSVVLHRLGATAVPLLGRELCNPDRRRREAARAALGVLASTAARERVIEALRSIGTVETIADEIKVCALGLLAELGATRTTVTRFADPLGVQRQSALALAAQLDSAADVASAADLMVRQLLDTDVIQMIEILADSAPSSALRLGTELHARLDVASDVRDQIARTLPGARDREKECGTDPRRAEPGRAVRPARPPCVAVLVDAAARLVVVASRKAGRRWRRWAVLIGASGRIEDCLHEDEAGAGGDALIESLCADGYRVASTELDHARTVVAAAARLTASHSRGDALSSPYYLGRDLLDLGDAHLGERARASASAGLPTATIAQAIELLADGEPARALALLGQWAREAPGDAGNPDAAAALAACFSAQGDHAAAIEPLGRAIAAEPAFPLHHWNLAAALHGLGDPSGCYHALRRFIATSGADRVELGNPELRERPEYSGRSGLVADREQLARISGARRILADLERTALLTGISLDPRSSSGSSETSDADATCAFDPREPSLDSRDSGRRRRRRATSRPRRA